MSEELQRAYIAAESLRSALVCITLRLFMATLCNRAGHIYFHPSSFLFSSPNLSSRRLDVYHTCTHGVALVRI